MANQQDIYNILHGNEYNDYFDENDHDAMTLFRPDAFLSQMDLNEMQSRIHNQFRLFGNWNFHNGTIISGMNLTVNDPNKNNQNSNHNAVPADQQNLLSENDISAINAVINRNQYGNSGTVDIASEAETSDSYPGVYLNIGNLPKGTSEVTLSFSVQKEQGTLSNLIYIANNGIKARPVVVDKEQATDNIQNTSVNDGKVHTVQATFHLQGATTLAIAIQANNGLDMTKQSNSVRFKLSDIMINQGENPYSWRLSSSDSNSSTDNVRNVTASISSGYVYLDGAIRQVPAQSQQITGVGTETLGVSLNSQFQPGSYDTTKGAISQGERLADHLTYNVQLQYDDPQSATIYTLVNGHIQNGNASTGNTHLDEILAERMYDQSGSFRVNGFAFHTVPDPNNSMDGDLLIDKGTAYVMGYGIYKTEPTTIPFKESRKTEHIPNETLTDDPQTYNAYQQQNSFSLNSSQVAVSSSENSSLDSSLSTSASSAISSEIASVSDSIDSDPSVSSESQSISNVVISNIESAYSSASSSANNEDILLTNSLSTEYSMGTNSAKNDSYNSASESVSSSLSSEINQTVSSAETSGADMQDSIYEYTDKSQASLQDSMNKSITSSATSAYNSAIVSASESIYNSLYDQAHILSANEKEDIAPWVSEPLNYQPVVSGSIQVSGVVHVGGQGGQLGTSNDKQYYWDGKEDNPNHWIYNQITLPADGSFATFPDIFQTNSEYQNGGIIGSFYIREYDTTKSAKENPVASVYYDDPTGTTYVERAAEPKADPDLVVDDSSVHDDTNNGYSYGQGITPTTNGNIYGVDFDFDDSQTKAIFGTHSVGRSLYVEGYANYMFVGPNSKGITPDYLIYTDKDSSNDKNIIVKGNPLNDTRIAFNVNGTSGIHPAMHGDHSVTVSYDCYLAQACILNLDKNGNFSLLPGKPAPMGHAQLPEQETPNVLRLGYVVLLPDTYKSNCQYSSVTRIPFSGLQDLATRVENLEQIMQNDLLDKQAHRNIDPQTIANTLDDDFTTFSNADFTSSYMNVAYDLAHGVISVNDRPGSVKALRPSLPNDNEPGEYTTSEHLGMASINTYYPQEWQNQQTGWLPINSDLQPNGSVNGLLNITPNADTYVDCSKYSFDIDGTPSDIQLHNWFTYSDSLYPHQNEFNNLSSDNGFGGDYSAQGNSEWSMRHHTGNQTAKTGNEYVPVRSIQFSTDWLTPNSKGYYIVIDDDYNNPITISDNQADNHGSLNGNFILPDNLQTGVLKITLTNTDTKNHIQGDTVSTTYYSNGINNDDKDTVARTYSATDNYGNVDNPLIAEVFTVQQDSTLTSVDLPIQAGKSDNSNQHILVQLRSVDNNDMPTNRVIAQSTLGYSDIISGEMTHFTFDDPVFVSANTKIALTIYSESNSYSVGMNTIPMKTIIKQVASQPNMELYIDYDNELQNVPDEDIKFTLNRASFNRHGNLTFAPCDLTKYYGNGSKKSQDVFNTISKEAVLCDYITPDNTSLSWTMRVGSGNDKKGIDYKDYSISSRKQLTKITDNLTDTLNDPNENGQEDKFNQVRSLQLTCHLHWSDTNQNTFDERNNDCSRVSPMINLGSLAIAVSEAENTPQNGHLGKASTKNDNNSAEAKWLLSNADGIYVSVDKNIMQPNYDTVITTFDAHTDNYTRVVPLYSFDGGINWTVPEYNIQPNGQNGNSPYVNYPKVTPVDSEFNRYTFKTTLPQINSSNDKYDYQSTASADQFKMALVLLTTSPYHQPEVRRLSNILTREDGDDINNDLPFAGDNSGNQNGNNWSGYPNSFIDPED